MENNQKFLTNSIANNLGLFIIFIFALAPLIGFATITFAHRPLEQFLILLCALYLFLFLFEKGRMNLHNSFILFLLLFFLYTFLQDIYVVDTKVSFSYLRNNSILGSFLICVLLSNLIIPKKFFNLIFKLNYWIVILAFLVIIVQQFYSENFFVSYNERLARIALPFYERRLPSIYSWIGSSAILGLSFFPVLGLIIEDDILKNKKRYFLLLFVGLVVALFNKSRFMMINQLILFILIPIHKGFNLSKFLKYSFTILALLISLYLGAKATNFDIDTIIKNRILEQDKGGLAEGSAGSRLLAFEIFAKLYPENPIFGKGKFHSFGEGRFASRDIQLLTQLSGRSSQIHVGYLSLLYYYGLVGGITFIIFLILLTKKLYQDARKTNKYAPFLGWIMFIITNWTGVYLQIFIMGIVLCLFQNQYNIALYEEQFNKIEDE